MCQKYLKFFLFYFLFKKKGKGGGDVIFFFFCVSCRYSTPSEPWKRHFFFVVNPSEIWFVFLYTQHRWLSPDFAPVWPEWNERKMWGETDILEPSPRPPGAMMPLWLKCLLFPFLASPRQSFPGWPAAPTSAFVFHTSSWNASQLFCLTYSYVLLSFFWPSRSFSSAAFFQWAVIATAKQESQPTVWLTKVQFSGDEIFPFGIAKILWLWSVC